MKIKDLETGKIQEWSIDAILAEINRDRSSNWIDYNEHDYLDGWDNFVEGEFYTRHII